MTKPSTGPRQAAYDLMGDIHGQAQALHDLLQALGYRQQDGVYRHPQGRQVIFVGDLIDRGPQVREVLQVVRAMVEAGQALICMGNHEYNILAYHTWVDGQFLRPHTAKNAGQIAATLHAFVGHKAEWLDYLNWFWQLPLFLELPGVRVVHACWDAGAVEWVRQTLPGARLTPEFFYASAQKHSPEYRIVESLLKGWELPLPEGEVFHDKDGNARSETRIRWWRSDGATWSQVAIGIPRQHPLLEQPFEGTWPGLPYTESEQPVFFGHYWLRGTPHLQASNVCCLDYSAGKGGDLLAYRWDGESQLDVDKMVWVAVKP